MTKIVIVGGVAGGATAAARIRRLDESAEIIIFERGEQVSYANCGLPYHIGNVIFEREKLLLQTPEGFYQRYRVEVRTAQEVISVDSAGKTARVRNLQSGETYTESYDKLILATGAQPVMPEADSEAQELIFALHTMKDMDLIIDRIQECRPRRIAVIGGGFVGLETAENLSHLDFEVSLIQRSAQVLSQLDPEMATFAHDTLRSNGIDLLLNSPIQSLQRNGSALSITFKDGRKLDTDMVIAALGVRPLNALAVSAALELDANGAVITDAHMRSSDPHIYAVGDVVSTEEIVTRSRRTVALAGPANRQARVAADNICGVTSTYNGAQASAILKLFDKTVSFTGISEKVAQANGLNYDKIYLFSPSHASYYPGSEDMIAKVLFDKESGRILGAQIFGGKGVDKRCDTLAIAIRSGLTPDDLKDMELCYAPPYASAKEPVNVIGNMIGNLLAGCVNQHHWHDIADLPRDGSVTLLDVRTATEYAEGAIPGYLNIPVDDLRERLSELDRSKPVYLYCHSGLRSYVAARILTQQGFTCSHLGGGYRLYQHIAAASLV